MSKQYNLKKICSIALIGFLVVALAIYLIAGDAFKHRQTRSATVDAAFVTGLLVDGTEVEQTFTPDSNTSWQLIYSLNCTVGLMPAQ